MEVIAKLHYLHIAPRKVRLVGDVIKGLAARDAALQLKFLPKRSSLPMEKLLASAVANAKHNFNLEEKNLRVKTVLVDGGPVQKRMRARAFGRAAMLKKRTSHVTLILDELIPTKRTAKQGVKKSAPEPRQVTSLDELKDLREETGEGDTRRREEMREIQRGTGQKGFVKRIFNRKAI